MAVLKLSSLLTRISGKIGGSVFAKTQYGQVVKSNAFSLPQRSTRQLQQQAKIQFVSSRWLLTSAAEKIDWANQAFNYPFQNKVNVTSYYNGYNLFLMLNNNLLAADLPVNLTVPVFQSLVLGTYSKTTFTTTNFQVRYVGGAVGETILIYASRGLPPGQTLKVTDLVLIQSFSILFTNQTFIITTEYNKIFGTPVIGLKYYSNCKIIATASGNKTNFSTVVSQVVVI